MDHMADQRIKALLISMGGSPERVIYSINELKPECLCFFASEETRMLINNDVLPKLSNRPVWMAEIITGDADDLLSCYKAINDKWKELQKNWRLQSGDWVVDYTGGTKPMVAALVLSTINDTSGYRYISGKERTKGGTGIVIDGKEQVLHQINPWDQLAVKERQDASVLFGRARYKQVAEIFAGVAMRVSGGEKHLYKALSDVAEGYGLWDNLEHKYDDAVARLYRAVEAYAQIRLAGRGINTSDVQENQLPPDLSQEFANKFRSEIDSRISLPLYGAYKILESLGDPAGIAFFENWQQMKLLLDSRNKSILAHGFEPVKRERYEEMLKLICRISGVNEQSLPGFPDLHL